MSFSEKDPKDKSKDKSDVPHLDAILPDDVPTSAAELVDDISNYQQRMEKEWESAKVAYEKKINRIMNDFISEGFKSDEEPVAKKPSGDANGARLQDLIQQLEKELGGVPRNTPRRANFLSPAPPEPLQLGWGSARPGVARKIKIAAAAVSDVAARGARVLDVAVAYHPNTGALRAHARADHRQPQYLHHGLVSKNVVRPQRRQRVDDQIRRNVAEQFGDRHRDVGEDDVVARQLGFEIEFAFGHRRPPSHLLGGDARHAARGTFLRRHGFVVGRSRRVQAVSPPRQRRRRDPRHVSAARQHDHLVLAEKNSAVDSRREIAVDQRLPAAKAVIETGFLRLGPAAQTSVPHRHGLGREHVARGDREPGHLGKGAVVSVAAF